MPENLTHHLHSIQTSPFIPSPPPSDFSGSETELREGEFSNQEINLQFSVPAYLALHFDMLCTWLKKAKVSVTAIFVSVFVFVFVTFVTAEICSTTHSQSGWREVQLVAYSYAWYDHSPSEETKVVSQVSPMPTSQTLSATGGKCVWRLGELLKNPTLCNISICDCMHTNERIFDMQYCTVSKRESNQEENQFRNPG